MSIAFAPPPTASNTRLLTCADVAALPEDLPTGRVHYELLNGRLNVKAPAGNLHGAAQSNMAAYLKFQGELRGLGKSRTEVGVILSRRPDRLVAPDNLFVSDESLPLQLSPEGYLETIPELVVEIRSKNDSLDELTYKAADYLKAGVRLVWIADPFAKTVTAYRRDLPPQVLTESDTLTAEDIIPGFRLPVADVFRE